MQTTFSYITVINDGQFKFPVSTEALNAWESTNGEITPSNYEQFCNDVPCALPDVHPGTKEMIEVCDALVESGANYRRY